jgi:TatA/E family protein of Tat protein translocase
MPMGTNLEFQSSPFPMTSNVGDTKVFDWKILLIILAIVIVIFGTKRLRSIGSDLGAGIKGIKDGFGPEETKATPLKDNSEPKAADVRANADAEARVQQNRD